MRIRLNSIFVADQGAALDFYTDVLGFAKKTDLPAGEFRWLTVVSADEPDGTELVLEPNANPDAATYQKALYEGGIPATAFEVIDIAGEHQRLTALGVEFRGEPADAGDVVIAVFDDTCGNLIQLYEVSQGEE